MDPTTEEEKVIFESVAMVRPGSKLHTSSNYTIMGVHGDWKYKFEDLLNKWLIEKPNWDQPTNLEYSKCCRGAKKIHLVYKSPYVLDFKTSWVFFISWGFRGKQ